jgi:methyltransferase (TIGR00027 family)
MASEKEEETAIQDVSDTAFMVAAYRAMESERANPLFRDPLAAVLAGEHGKKVVASMPTRAMMSGWSVQIRTCIIDNYIREAIASGYDMVVNLGAGLDTRPYRMELPATLRWVEADYPKMIDYKASKLAGEKPRCQLERVKIDLSDATARRKFLGEMNVRSSKILVLTEGVIPYLTEEQVGALANDLHDHASFGAWVADYFGPQTFEYRRKQGMDKAMKNAPFLFEPKDYFGFFRAHRWTAKEVRYLQPESIKLKRPMPLPLLLRIMFVIFTLFMGAEKRREAQEFMGYVWFERTV